LFDSLQFVEHDSLFFTTKDTKDTRQKPGVPLCPLCLHVRNRPQLYQRAEGEHGPLRLSPDEPDKAVTPSGADQPAAFPEDFNHARLFDEQRKHHREDDDRGKDDESNLIAADAVALFWLRLSLCHLQ
jgi:hypothetical protein